MQKIIFIALIGLCGVSTFSSFYGGFYYLEVLSHFKVQFFFIILFLNFLLLFFKPKKLALLSFFVTLYAGISLVIPWYWSLNQNASPKKEEISLRVLLSNVHTSNKNFQGVIKMINRENPDIFVALEVNERWINQLQEIHAYFPYRVLQPRQDNFGIALYSKIPLTEQEVVDLSDAHVPSIHVKFEWQNRLVHLLGTHPLPPVRGRGWKLRNQQLENLAHLINQQQLPTIVAGDLNVSMWSPFYKRFIRQTRLVNSRKGFGLFLTWPMQKILYRIPIDHILFSQPFHVSHMRLGPSIGSDHFPVIVDLFL